jgi:methionyl-tRNA formyltransferase
MRIVFMGASEFSVPTLRKIAADGHAIVAVYTKAPRPGGRRGLEIKKTPVHDAAETMGSPVCIPISLNGKDSQEVFREHHADVAVVVAYGLLLPKEILVAPKFGCVNLHASLLPRWRGAAPIQRAIMAGDRETGVDLMRIETGLDTGAVAIREIIPIRSEDTAGDLMHRLANIAAEVAAAGLFALEHGTLEFRGQANSGASYAHKIDKNETQIDWSRSATEVRNHIHGLSPAPGAFSQLPIGERPERIKIYRGVTVSSSGAPGTILDREMTIACGEGAIECLLVQRPGGVIVSGAELMRRSMIPIGARFTPSTKTSSGIEPRF